MALATASRFAVLNIEDEDENREIAVKPKKPATVKKQTSADAKKKQQNKTNKKGNGEQKGGIDQELKNLAFGIKKTKKQSGSSQPNTNAAKKEKLTPPPQPPAPIEGIQDEDERKRNEEVAQQLYEEEIQQAIFLSKLDYEEKREFYEAMQQEAVEAKLAEKKKKKAAKKEKPCILTLGEFNQSPSQLDRLSTFTQIKINDASDESRQKQFSPPERNFFEEVAEDVQKIIKNDHKIKTIPKKEEANVPTDVRILQLQDDLEKKDVEIKKLIAERDKLKEENWEIKEMNAKFCGILTAGQLKESTDALLQVEDLIKDKDELANELATLHTALEQERSKVHSLQQQLQRVQGSRKESK